MKETIFKLVMRVVGNREFTFYKDGVYLWNVPVMILPFDPLCELKNSLFNKFGEISKAIFYTTGKFQGEYGTKLLISRFNFKAKEGNQDFFIDQTKLVGVGPVKVIKMDVDKRYFLDESSYSISKYYSEKFGNQKNAVDDYTLGLITGGSKAFYDTLHGKEEELFGKEIECLGKGDGKCVYEISRFTDAAPPDVKVIEKIAEKIKELEKNKVLDTLINPPKLIKNQQGFDLLIKLKKIYPRNFFKHNLDMGQFHMLESPSLIITVGAFILLNKLLNEWDETSKDEIFHAGNHHIVYILNDVLTNIKFTKNPEDIKLALQLLTVFGFGYPELLRMSGSKIVVKFGFNYYASLYTKLFGIQKNAVDHYIAGMLSGLFSVILKSDIKFTETSCIAHGKKECIFESV